MCRNIKPLFNFDPPATNTEVQEAALQFVRKISGFNAPSQANREAFEAAVVEIAAASSRLLFSLETAAPSKNREVEAAKARAKAAERFGHPVPAPASRSKEGHVQQGGDPRTTTSST